MLATSITLATLAGCTLFEAGRVGSEAFGKLYYLDGAGNWGFGAKDVARGLQQAGYRGDVEVFRWTMTFIPLADQLNYYGAKARAADLAEKITDYRRRYPTNDINVIALSAGTGVAAWAVEMLEPGLKIDNLVFLGSSLSHDYDTRLALNHMTGKIYVYYSPYDDILRAVNVVGTIDQKRGSDAAGQVGLIPMPGYEHRVVNIGWSHRWVPLGWTGDHTDCTNSVFVRREIAPRLFARATTVAAHRAVPEASPDGSLTAVSH